MISVIRPPQADATDPVDRYLSAFSEDSPPMIQNVEAGFSVWSGAHDLALPVTINDHEYDNSYVCSPYTALVPYCLQELSKLNNPLLRAMIRRLILLMAGSLKKHQINKVVHVNNWLLSTNLYIDGLENKTDQLIQPFISRYDDHALIFRSLNEFANAPLLSGFREAGCLIVPTRQVYLYDPSLKDYWNTHNYQIDQRLLTKTSYQYVSGSAINQDDHARIVELYNMLYIQKYSRHNPQFTTRFIEQISQHPYFQLEGFRNADGVLDAVGGRFSISHTTTLPIVGYDTTKPQKLGLYRMVLMSTMQHAHQQGLCFNASSGAAGFKRLRGAVPMIEYSAVYVRHLPRARQRIWHRLAFILNRLFVPVMQRYEL
ncbi:hypothetical protein [Gynuella sunshinyii]|uniref:BioF2-like acetyltransferase domain-containing protein n=1 Tax=Gynuella sunshinyii YC6258 TaxID=1445510 RepID=A0A0C5VWY0_9GAMM|nr:hypothetical protein [Gynuella sunshinyii]AJQ97803.1 hypothetical Protein YC6258_05775 [Gynuella sunshinyii YC6258]